MFTPTMVGGTITLSQKCEDCVQSFIFFSPHFGQNDEPTAIFEPHDMQKLTDFGEASVFRFRTVITATITLTAISRSKITNSLLPTIDSIISAKGFFVELGGETMVVGVEIVVEAAPKIINQNFLVSSIASRGRVILSSQ